MDRVVSIIKLYQKCLITRIEMNARLAKLRIHGVLIGNSYKGYDFKNRAPVEIIVE